ncbi:MAG: phage tail protein [Alphaproteobacteria bacterium]|nr:phage tail protein [Alphaproteobacteria bacterium]
MPDGGYPIPSGETIETPYGSFAFHVAFEAGGGGFGPFGSVDPGIVGGFSDVSGLEAMMEHKVIKVGGRNYGPQLRAGPVTFGTVILKRGIVRAQPLWAWWSLFAGADGKSDGLPTPANRCNLVIALIDPSPAKARTAAVAWRLRNAMPVKFRIGDLNAKGGEVAVEEIHLVHEGLDLVGAAG